MEVKTTLYTHMKEQIDSIKDENIRLSEKVHVRRLQLIRCLFDSHRL